MSGHEEQQSKPYIAIALMLAACMVLPLMDATSKLLTSTYAPSQIIWLRYVFHVLLLTPFVLWAHGRRAFTPPRFGLQVLRGVLMAAMALFYVSALQRIPLVNAISITFVFPFFITMAAPFVLGERVGRLRWLAVVAGFAGVLMVIQPEAGGSLTGPLLALAAALSYAAYILLTRKLAISSAPLVLLYFIGLVGVVVTALPAWQSWQPVIPSDWLLFVLVGLFSVLAHLLIIMAYARGEASLIAPFTYFQIVGNVMLGFIWFGDFPALLTWAGVAVIVLSGLIIFWQQKPHKQDA